MFGSVKKIVSAFETRKQPHPPPPHSSSSSSIQNPSSIQQSSPSTTPTPALNTSPCLSTPPEPHPPYSSGSSPSTLPISPTVVTERCHDGERERQDVVLRGGRERQRIPRVRVRDSWPMGRHDCFERNFLSFVTIETREPISCSKCPPEFDRSRLRPIHCKSTSTEELKTKANTTSTQGLNTFFTTGLNSTSTTGLNTTSTTGLNPTSTTGLNSTSTTGLNTTSTTGLNSTFSTGLNTTSTTGLNSTSTTGLNTTSTTGLNSTSTTGLNTTSTTELNTTSTTGLNTLANTTSTTRLKTTDNTMFTVGLITTSSTGFKSTSNTSSIRGLNTTSTMALCNSPFTTANTMSTICPKSSIGTNAGSAISTTANVTRGSYSCVTTETSSKKTTDASVSINANLNSDLLSSLGGRGPVLVGGENKSVFQPLGVPVYLSELVQANATAITQSGQKGQGKGMSLHSQLKLRPSDSAFFSLLLLLRSGSSNSMIAIDNKIEQAMDLVKAHLMLAVREEVEVLREQIKELVERNAQLERENYILRALRENR
ncbi:mucin-5AC-like isoform X1 [Silurus meridionalis]|nr:mucin-5AC-like isoform X1 [Silurus meridionalis]XP_046725254.1 mucin-5AC-like isoform X1 [Silurus meridionalis]